MMLDLETAGLKPGCAVLSVGVVAFDPEAGELDEKSDRLLLTIDAESSQSRGLVLEAGTVMWWMDQSEAARREAWRGEYALLTSLSILSGWLKNLRDEVGHLRLWCNGAGDDAPWLAAAYRAAGINAPWRHDEVRDVRTVLEQADLVLGNYRRPGDVEHSALSDAIVQARAVCDAYRLLGLATPKNGADA